MPRPLDKSVCLSNIHIYCYFLVKPNKPGGVWPRLFTISSVHHASMTLWSSGSLPAQSLWTRLTFGLRGVTVLQVVGGPAGREAIGRAQRVFTAAAAAVSLPVLAWSPRHCCRIQPDWGSPCCLYLQPAVAGCHRLLHRGSAAGQRPDSGAKKK